MKIFDKYRYGSYYKKLLISCYVFYFFTIAIKLTYSVQIEEIIDHFKRDRSDVALGLTIYYFVYAAAQVVLSLFIQKINIKRFLVISTLLSGVSFGIVGFTSSLWQVALILGANGIFQCAVWGGITFVISRYFPVETLSYAMKFMATGLALANAATYGVSAFFVQVFDWRYTFVFFAILLVIFTFNMVYQIKRTENALKKGEAELFFKHEEEGKGEFVVPHDVKFNKPLLLGYLFVLSFVVTTLTYGVGNWVPGLLKNVHNFPSSLSILISLITPVVTVPATILMYILFDKYNKIMRISAYVAALTASLLVLMIFIYDSNLIVATVMSTLLRFIIAAFATSSSTYVTTKFEYHINAGSAALLVNAVAALGAGIAPFFTGIIIESRFGWQGYYVALAGIAAAALLINIIGCIVISKKKNLTKWI